MAKEQATFKEVGRLQVSPATAIVVSQVIVEKEVKGLNINSYVVSPHYTGFSPKTFVPADMLEEFGEMIKNVLAQ